MLNDELRRLISDTSEELELDESVVEKDYYVTQVIHALSDAENNIKISIPNILLIRALKLNIH